VSQLSFLTGRNIYDSEDPKSLLSFPGFLEKYPKYRTCFITDFLKFSTYSGLWVKTLSCSPVEEVLCEA
jgi:hypothetical protein